MAKIRNATSSVATALHGVLVDTYALAVKTHSAHWNVTGSGFFQLHAAFMTQYEALFEAADLLAERIRALSLSAPSGMSAFAKATSLADNANNDGLNLAKTLAADHRTISAACAKAVSIAQDAHDEASADLLIGRIEEHDKTAWMLESAAH
jgi:starvation-inducible DNA-binding protein